MIERLAAGAVSVAAVAAVGAASSAHPMLGIIADWMPVLTGIICALLVWCVKVMDSTKKKTWTYNICVGMLTSIFTAVIVREYALTPFYAMMVGIGAGSMGIGIVSLAKPFLLAILTKSMESLKETKNDQLEDSADPPESHP